MNPPGGGHPLPPFPEQEQWVSFFMLPLLDIFVLKIKHLSSQALNGFILKPVNRILLASLGFYSIVWAISHNVYANDITTKIGVLAKGSRYIVWKNDL